MPPAQPTILGVLNLSPESPNRDSVARGPAEAVERAGRLCAAGAAIVDVGARSSNFAAADCGPEVERRRMVPVVAALKAAGFAVSVDTWEPAVMREAIAAGADMINAADGLQSPEALRAAATAGVPVVVPFVNGPDPRRLRPMEGPDPVAAIARGLEAALTRARRAGIEEQLLILDPGTGFARRELGHAAHDALQRRVHAALPRLAALGRPLLVALPRRPRREETLALAHELLDAGVDYVRAHDPEVVTAAVAARTARAGEADGPPGPPA